MAPPRSLGATLGALFGGLAGAPDGVHLRIWNQLHPWVTHLTQSATVKWLPYLASWNECAVPIMRGGQVVGPCDHVAIAPCQSCGRPTCLQHCRLDQHADITCYLCLEEGMRLVAQQRAQQPPPESEQRPPGGTRRPQPPASALIDAYKTLGLRPGVTWDEVRQAHRTLSAKHHPDRHKTKSAKEKAQTRFVKVQQAFDLLKTQYPEAAA